MTHCPVGTYSNTTHCLTCPAGCAACTGGTIVGGFGQQCTSCKNEATEIYNLISGTTVCSTSCPTGQFVGTGATANLCVPCASGCSACNGATLNNCSACAAVSGTNYYLVYGTTCATNCPSAQYQDVNGGTLTCLPCDITCSDCYAIPTNCTICGTTAGITRYLFTSGCVQTCPKGYYGWLSDSTTISNRCYACNPACAACT